MKQRIFVAIGISEDLKASIAKWQKQNAKLAIRFIQPKNLHLTLIPPWYEDPKKIIKQMQKFSSSVKPFSLKFHLIESRPRLVWMKGKFSRELVSLQKELTRFLHVKLESRLLLPHITLARFKKNIIFEEKTIDWSMHVNSFVLMKSSLSPNGANYEVLAEFPSQNNHHPLLSNAFT
ncbi:2'-5' RNA ligase [Candidatus Gottesmanbacteria bacterium RIFCSPLOWO2_01_FULL_43_11b]|uniref:RNA 2',3'-cyclic phosphodiesterase n=1 Tax=Candidatus Gottesmanbacteria bacterium RIFCSPLOWO2_01_FULL_43_11b TaxID=1798392 RepID=A0A1F6AG54_9BACT|nr:MAG: 2'-5' RNA ligase [Candidatus Gottesmanbacteria bacterium RIFCSPLOWO2_01_FULL_43_11b]